MIDYRKVILYYTVPLILAGLIVVVLVFRAQHSPSVLNTLDPSEIEWHESDLYTYPFQANDFRVVNDSLIVVLDKTGDPGGLVLISYPDGHIIHSTGLGAGPGEVAGGGEGFISVLKPSNRVLLYDTGHQRLTIYHVGEGLEPLEQHAIPAFQATVINDSIVVAIPFAFTPLAVVTPLSRVRTGGAHDHDGAEHGEDIAIANTGYLAPISENFTLKYGPMRSCGSGAVKGFDYSSVIAKIGSRGLTWNTTEPARILFPPREPGTPVGSARIPHIGNRRGTVDIACHEQRVYILHSGRSATDAAVAEYARVEDYPALSDYLSRGNELFVYDMDRGELILRTSLPIDAQRIDVTDEHIYLLSSADMPPTIIRYNKFGTHTDFSPAP